MNPLRWFILTRAERTDLRQMLVAATPLIIINLAHTGLQFTDAVMVARLGKESLAAVLPAGLMYFVPLSFGWGLLTALNTFVSQCLGRGEPRGCGHYGFQALALAIIYGLMLLVFWPLAPHIFKLLDHAPAVQALEVVYFRISLIGAAPALIVAALSSFFTGLQRTSILMYSAIAATLLNIFFNWIFIFGNLGAPALGLGGSAIGTVLATVCQVALLLYWYWRPHYRVTYGTLTAKIDFPAIWRLFKIGAPGGGQFVFDLLTWGVFIIWMIGFFGTDHLAANTIVVRYVHLAFMPAIAVGAILTARVGAAIGEKNPDRAKEQAATAFRLVAAYMSLIGLLFLTFQGPLMRLFTDEQAIIAAGGKIFICVAIYQVFDAMYITYSHALRGAGDTLWQAVALIVYSITLLVGGGYAMVTLFPELASMGPWIATSIYVLFLGASVKWRWHQEHWRKIDIFKSSPSH